MMVVKTPRFCLKYAGFVVEALNKKALKISMPLYACRVWIVTELLPVCV
jgi:hypothetical protein